MTKLIKYLILLILSIALLYLGATFYYIKTGGVVDVLTFVYDRPNPNWQQSLREYMLFCCKRFTTAQMEDEPPLSIALGLKPSITKKIELIDFLVKQGADVNQAHSPSKMTALHMALLEDNKDITVVTSHLLKLGANPNLKNALNFSVTESAKHLMSKGIIQPNNQLIHLLETYGARYATIPNQPKPQ